jgi:peptidoglycan/LPS O-acetylase OafA/YrhL
VKTDAVGELGRRVASRFGGHIPALDGVRGLAVLGVLLFHFVGTTTATNPFERMVNRILNYGSLGVDLFFILSGFLITGILYDSRSSRSYFRNFYMRRVLRIFPLYYAVLAVVFFVVPAVPALEGSELVGLREHQAWAWLYGVNVYLSIHGAWVLSYLTHFWSLAVEEHFYFVWPLVVWLLGARPRVLMGGALFVAALSYGGRVAASLAGVSPVVTTVLTPFQLDALCIGGFFAVLARQEGGEATLRRWVPRLAAVVTVLLGASFAFSLLAGPQPALTSSVRSGLFRLAFVALLLHSLTAPATAPASRFFRSGVMVTLGKYSYGLYVYHHFLSYYFEKHATEFTLAQALGSHTLAVALQALVGMSISMAVAWLSYEYFEKHFLRLKRFWPSSREEANGGAS